LGEFSEIWLSKFQSWNSAYGIPFSGILVCGIPTLEFWYVIYIFYIPIFWTYVFFTNPLILFNNSPSILALLEIIECVPEYRYLGQTLSFNNKMEKELKIRGANSWKAFWAHEIHTKK